jgi:hypothetical protein
MMKNLNKEFFTKIKEILVVDQKEETEINLNEKTDE